MHRKHISKEAGTSYHREAIANKATSYFDCLQSPEIPDRECMTNWNKEMKIIRSSVLYTQNFFVLFFVKFIGRSSSSKTRETLLIIRFYMLHFVNIVTCMTTAYINHNSNCVMTLFYCILLLKSRSRNLISIQNVEQNCFSFNSLYLAFLKCTTVPFQILTDDTIVIFHCRYTERAEQNKK